MMAVCKLCRQLVSTPAGLIYTSDQAAMVDVARAAYQHVCACHQEITPLLDQVLTLATHWLAALVLEGELIEEPRQQMGQAVHAALDGLVVL